MRATELFAFVAQSFAGLQRAFLARASADPACRSGVGRRRVAFLESLPPSYFSGGGAVSRPQGRVVLPIGG